MAGGSSNVEAIRERAAIRTAIKKEFQKQVTNPHRHGSGEGGVLVSAADFCAEFFGKMEPQRPGNYFNKLCLYGKRKVNLKFFGAFVSYY